MLNLFGSSTPDLGFATGVTADNYTEKAATYMKLHSTDPEKLGVTIHRDLQPVQWGAWLDYFRTKRIAHNFMLRREMYIVPADWPEKFDAEWKT